MYGTHDGHGYGRKIKKYARCMHVKSNDECSDSKKKKIDKNDGCCHLHSFEPGLD